MTDDDLKTDAIRWLTRTVAENGKAELTLGGLLTQFGYDSLTPEASDEIYDALRDAGLREEPLLSTQGLTPASSIRISPFESKRQTEDKSLITWGFITAVIFAPVALYFGIRLLVRDRIGPGIGVILTALILWGVGITLVVSKNSEKANQYDAHNTALQEEVAQAIEGKSNGEGTITGVSCVPSSNSELTCIGKIASGAASLSATWPVTIDTETGKYIIHNGTP